MTEFACHVTKLYGQKNAMQNRKGKLPLLLHHTNINLCNGRFHNKEQSSLKLWEVHLHHYIKITNFSFNLRLYLKWDSILPVDYEFNVFWFLWLIMFSVGGVILLCWDRSNLQTDCGSVNCLYHRSLRFNWGSDQLINRSYFNEVTLINIFHQILQILPWSSPGLPAGAQPKSGGANLLFGQFFKNTPWTWTKFDRGASKILLCRPTTEYINH